MIFCEESLDFIVSFTKLFIFYFINFRVNLFISCGSNFTFSISFRINWFLTRIDFDLNIIMVFVIPFSFYYRIIFITLKLDFSQCLCIVTILTVLLFYPVLWMCVTVFKFDKFLLFTNQVSLIISLENYLLSDNSTNAFVQALRNTKTHFKAYLVECETSFVILRIKINMLRADVQSKNFVANICRRESTVE